MKRRRVLFLLSMILFSASCSHLGSAPIFNGAYLKYKMEGEYLTIKFSEVKKESFAVTISSTNQYFEPESLLKSRRKDGKVLVDQSMKRPNGRILRLRGVIGPIWIPQMFRKPGSQEGSDMIFDGVQTDAIKQWKGQEVYAVTASVFKGALSGEWFFDVKTGFLLGCRTRTIVSDMFSSGQEEPTLILVDSNIPGLSLPDQVKEEVKQPVAKVKAPTEEEIKIEGIIVIDGVPVVMIKGRDYRVGEFIQGRKIVEILEDRIKVLHNEKIETIR